MALEYITFHISARMSAMFWLWRLQSSPFQVLFLNYFWQLQEAFVVTLRCYFTALH